jgi:ABC-type dipeptide/oligopeptide/nickel transport system permease subunit
MTTNNPLATPVPGDLRRLGEQGGELSQPGPAQRALALVRNNPLGAVGGVLIVCLIVVGLFAPLLAPHPVNAFVGKVNQAPSAAYPFGTDRLGQDIFSRVIRGARISLEVGMFAVGIGTLAGLLIGITSAYKGGIIDTVTQRGVDIAIAFPQLILLLILVRILGPSIQNVILAISLGIIPGVARVIRGATLSEKNNQYIDAARSMGASDARILFRHLVPNVAPLAIVIATTLLGGAILAEAALSFLGLGVPPPNPSWGADINSARNVAPYNTWAALFPGIAISLSVLGFNLLGDALRDILDPRLRGSS